MDFSNSTDIAVASSPGADVSGIALLLLYQLFGFVNERLRAGGVSTDNDGPSVENKVIMSDVECENYRNLARDHSDGCDSNSMVYDYDVDQQDVRKFMKCLTYRFLTEMDANSSCMNNSGRSDNDTNVQNIMTLSSKNRLFHSFMSDTLNMTSTSKSSNDSLKSDEDTNATMFSYDSCDLYRNYVKNKKAESKCLHNTSTMDSNTELPYDECLFYRFMNSLGADSGCSDHFSLRESCGLYQSTMRAVVQTIICIIGLIGNSISLAMFCCGLVDTSTTY